MISFKSANNFARLLSARSNGAEPQVSREREGNWSVYLPGPCEFTAGSELHLVIPQRCSFPAPLLAIAAELAGESDAGVFLGQTGSGHRIVATDNHSLLIGNIDMGPVDEQVWIDRQSVSVLHLAARELGENFLLSQRDGLVHCYWENGTLSMTSGHGFRQFSVTKALGLLESATKVELSGSVDWRTVASMMFHAMRGRRRRTLSMQRTILRFEVGEQVNLFVELGNPAEPVCVGPGASWHGIVTIDVSGLPDLLCDEVRMACSDPEDGLLVAFLASDRSLVVAAETVKLF